MASSCLSFAARRIEGSSSAAGGVTVGALVVFGAGAADGGVTTDAADAADARTLPSGGDAGSADSKRSDTSDAVGGDFAGPFTACGEPGRRERRSLEGVDAPPCPRWPR